MPADRAPSVLITGIHSDHGFAVSHAFRREGWFVIGCDHGSTTGRNARVHITADLTQEEDCRRAVLRAAELGNGLDCIVSCADVRVDGPVDEFGSQAWDVMMDVNAKSLFLLAKAAVPALEETHGTIVAIVPERAGAPEHAVYDASRAATNALMSSLAAELAPRGIHVHTVASDADKGALSPDEVALEVWRIAGADESGLMRSFAHAH